MRPISSVVAVCIVLALSLFLLMRFVLPNPDHQPAISDTQAHDAEAHGLGESELGVGQLSALPLAAGPPANSGIELSAQQSTSDAMHVVPGFSQEPPDISDETPKNFVAHMLQRAEEDPRVPYKLLVSYLQVEDKAEKLPLISAISALILLDDSGAVLEQKIIDRAVDSADADQALWSDLLREVGVRSGPARQQVLDQLPLTNDPIIVADLLYSLLPVEASAEEQLAVLAQLAPLVDHPDARVRGATIRQVAMWGGQEHIGMLENAMQDPSNEVRHAAAGAAMMSELRSDTVKYSLLQMLGNVDEAQDTRMQAYYALDNYVLTSDEQQTVAEWEILVTR